MSRKRRGAGSVDELDGYRGGDQLRDRAGDRILDRIVNVIDEAPAGLHDLNPPGSIMPQAWPLTLREMYSTFDGGRFFVETIELVAAAEVTADERGRWQIGTWDGDDISVAPDGTVWRVDAELGEPILDGTRPDRWLAGAIDACDLLFDGEGEYFETAFAKNGDITAEIVEQQRRAQLKRDAKAPGPRWQLARSLVARGELANARKEFEEVVEIAPKMSWAWLDLARLSETLGELPGAVDEATAAAEAAAESDDDYEGYFWAQVARLAARNNDEATRGTAAARALAATPNLRTAQLEGARAQIVNGDFDSAAGLLDLLRAIAPRDLDVLALASELTTARANAPAVNPDDELNEDIEDDENFDDDELDDELADDDE